jgi:hypothetical protein
VIVTSELSGGKAQREADVYIIARREDVVPALCSVRLHRLFPDDRRCWLWYRLIFASLRRPDANVRLHGDVRDLAGLTECRRRYGFERGLCRRLQCPIAIALQNVGVSRARPLRVDRGRICLFAGLLRARPESNRFESSMVGVQLAQGRFEPPRLVGRQQRHLVLVVCTIVTRSTLGLSTVPPFDTRVVVGWLSKGVRNRLLLAEHIVMFRHEYDRPPDSLFGT